MKRVERIFVFVGLLIMVLLLIRKILVERAISEKGVYVVGKVIFSTFGGDAGWGNKIVYEFDFKKYDFNYTGGVRQNKDSLVFLHLLKENPEQVRLVQDVLVPDCLNYELSRNLSWRNIPRCN
jgi:hypothetical protein